MTNGVNKVILLGNVGKDPSVRETASGAAVANFPIATSYSWLDKITNERREKTEWHSIVVFGNGLVDIVKKHVQKGCKVYIEGSLQTRKWKDSGGNDRYSTEIIMQGHTGTLIILGKMSHKEDSDSGNGGDQLVGGSQLVGGNQLVGDKPFGSNNDEDDDDIPF